MEKKKVSFFLYFLEEEMGCDILGKIRLCFLYFLRISLLNCSFFNYFKIFLPQSSAEGGSASPEFKERFRDYLVLGLLT